MPNLTDPTKYAPNLAPGWVYGIECKPYIKIGVAKNVAARLDTVRLHNPHPCAVVFKRKTVAPYHFEKKMHEILQHQAVGREWFSTTVEEMKAAAKAAGEYARAVWRKRLFEEIEWDAQMAEVACKSIDEFMADAGLRKSGAHSLGVPVRA